MLFTQDTGLENNNQQINNQDGGIIPLAPTLEDIYQPRQPTNLKQGFFAAIDSALGGAQQTTQLLAHNMSMLSANNF